MQTIVSRNTDPRYPTVVSITQIHAGSAYNVIPESAHLAGTLRTFRDEVRELVRARIRSLASGIAASFAATIDVDIRDIFTVLENHEAQTRAAAEAAREIVGDARIDTEPRPKMASEDFADMLRAVPGAYFWLGQTPGPAVHNPGYVFDDGILPIGASLLARIAERQLAGGKF
jgi:hippurate hydrolase